jgi:hypothetical protein
LAVVIANITAVDKNLAVSWAILFIKVSGWLTNRLVGVSYFTYLNIGPAVSWKCPLRRGHSQGGQAGDKYGEGLHGG